ncbi:MAG: M20/M25/M40 family metallo-hydrolase [Oscillospiraceae bacterium]|jgi:endoglucanase|nr:M20/M25/M40 family metallo-hydrolase [Oscillospiraceae bacterium]
MNEENSLISILTQFLTLPPDGSGALALLSAYAAERDSLRTDALGSVIWERAGEGEPILLEAHLDTIAMVATAVLPEGFLRVQPVGGVDRRMLPASAVTVWGREKLCGVVASVPPHLKDKNAPEVPEWPDMLVDLIGADERTSLVSPGDFISMDAPPQTLQNGTITAAGLDNRAGCATVLWALLLTRKCPHCVTAVFAVREETNGAGALTAAYTARAQSAIAVDVSFAQSPNVTPEEGGKLGGGAMLGISPVLDIAVTERLRRLAEREDIPLQPEVMGSRTGTDADKIQTVRAGIPTGLLSIPLRSMHTAAEIIALSDIENAAKLLAAAIK